MKKLSLEEKARRYDEAVEKAKSKIKGDKDHVLYEDDVIEIFPELKGLDLEDERIRTFLHHTFTAQYLCKDKLGKWHGEPVVNILAWLEKQGEHANFLSKIQVGDKVTRNEDGILVNLSQLNRVAKKDEKQGKQKPWSEDDESKIQGIINTLEGLYDNAASDTTKDLYRAKIDWLKLLKDRV